VTDPHNLQRFVDAQDGVYQTALAELKAGSKHSHWMWFIFPQLRGIGRSPTAEFYGISSLPEAQAYLGHPLLGPRLNECLEAILPWAGRLSARHILGDVDALKLCSSLTLFDQAEPNARFDAGLQAFFGGNPDERTLALLNARR
jgi:uncharacterized protein (DUF1810 family)